jgi:hypothetical protein
MLNTVVSLLSQSGYFLIIPDIYLSYIISMLLLCLILENLLYETVKPFLHANNKVVTDECTYQYQEVQIGGDLSRVLRPQKIIQDI